MAAIDLECDADISSVEVDTTEDGELDGNTETDCTGQSRNFTCSPSDPPASLISAQFDAVSEDVCRSPRLTVDFDVTFDDPERENQRITNVEVSGCSDTGGTGDEDAGAVPAGGVDSGVGDTAAPAAGPETPLPIAGASLLALASAGLFLRKIRTNP